MSDSQPVISVLMAVFDPPAHYLDKAIQSILEQTYGDFEFLIVDDGSHAKTGLSLMKWASSDKRIKLHSLPVNVGLTKALNFGIARSVGKFVARQDADDVAAPARLEESLRFLEQNPQLAAVGTEVGAIDQYGRLLGTRHIEPSLRDMDRRNVLCHGSMLFRAEVFERVHGYDERMRLSQDYELYLRMMRQYGMKIGVVPSTLYFLRQHPRSLSSQNAFRQFYFSVLAKALTLPGKVSVWRRWLFFAAQLVWDFVVTQRLLLVPFFRRYSTISDHPGNGREDDMKSNYKPVSACRMCGNVNLVDVVDLGSQYITGVFPATPDGSAITNGPLKLVKCHGEDKCGLLQLRHSYSPDEMYGENYGYRSGLNSSMVAHLRKKIADIVARVELQPGDLVIDIGSNDGTSLSAYPANLSLVGVDPVGNKFKRFYPSHVQLIPALFSADLIRSRFPEQQAKVITSFSMMYDLEDPLAFVSEIASLLDDATGIWVFEQSYMPLMLERMAFDTICHEHIEYYALKQIDWLLDRADLKIVDIEFNDVNGGSFSVVAARKSARYVPDQKTVSAILDREKGAGIDLLETYREFSRGIDVACLALKRFLASAKMEGKRVCGLGASTKGNVILQYCGLTVADIEAIGEVNPDKFGSFTPGTWIPVQDEAKVLASNPDYLLVMPWHFKANFLNNPLYKGRQLVFPLPQLEVVQA